MISAPLVLPASGLVLPNRLVKAATSENLAVEGRPTDGLVAVTERLARGGVGTIITGNVMVDRRGLESPRNVIIEDRQDIGALRRWADATHAHGAVIFMQLNHAGRQAGRSTTAEPLAPSAIKLRGYGPLTAKPRALADSEIEDIIERFVNAALIASEAGFDGVEIHAAHGYLISQFLSPLSNQRTDKWGGELEGRSRFLREIVSRTRDALPANRAIGVKLNSADFQRGGFDEDDALTVAKNLEALGVDFVEVSGGNYESPAMMRSGKVSERTMAREAYFATFSAQLASAIETPVLLTGGLRSKAAMNEVVKTGAAALVGMARPLIVEPDLPKALLSPGPARAAQIDLSTGIKKLDPMVEGLWYGRQIERMAAGRDPSLKLSRFVTVLRGFWRNYMPRRFFRPKPVLRRRLAA